jgi:hypothetical protein
MFRKTLLATTALVLGATVAFATTHGTPSTKIHPKHIFGTPGHTVHGVAVNFSIGNNHKGAVVRNNKSHQVPGATYDNFSKDANAEFISWYGFTAENSGASYYGSKDYHYKFSDVGYNAVGFTGAGKKVAGMTVAGFGYGSTDEFQGAILSATTSGLPNGDVAVTKSFTMMDTALCCSGAVQANFKGGKVNLKSGTEYFAAVRCASSPCYGGWNMEDTDMSGATVDYWHVTEHETYNFGTSCPSGTYCHTHTFSYASPWHASTYYPEAGAVIVK